MSEKKLTAIFDAIDNVSKTMDNISSKGTAMTDKIASSTNEINSNFDKAADSIGKAADSISDADSRTSHWTSSVGNYSTSALSAIYSTEELVEMGFKSSAALQEQEEMVSLCEKSLGQLNDAVQSSSQVHDELNGTMERASSVMSEVADNDKVSAESKEELAKASENASNAMKELETAQIDAQNATDYYNEVMASGTTNLDELESAAERVGHASENLAEANYKASTASDELAKETEKVSAESKDAEHSFTDAISAISSALAAAGITKTIKEIAEGVYELVDACSNAENIIVDATGATGETLKSLDESMLKVYSTAKDADLDSTAAGIGEINTRMGLTGDVLEDVTGKFLDYSSVTGSNVTNSVRNATQIMNKWNVDFSKTGSVLDKLTYAAQVSGGSVDQLSNDLIKGSAAFQEMGLDLDNAISMLIQFELYGMNGTTAITAMRTAVKNFAKDGLDANSALQSTIKYIAETKNVADATAKSVEVFGGRAGVDMANAIRSGAITVDTLNGNLDKAQGTLEKTAKASQTLENKWDQASRSIKSAFTSAVEPTLNDMSSGFADIVNNVGEYLNENPNVTKALTATGVGLGVISIALAGVTAAAAIATAATTAFGAAFKAALGPIGLGIIALSGITAAVAALGAMSDDTTETLTVASQKQQDELEDLNSEYKKACKTYGETSEEALSLKYQVDNLRTSFNQNKQTIADLCEEIDNAVETYNDVSKQWDENIEKMELENGQLYYLAQRYEELATKTQNGTTATGELKNVIDQLNEKMPTLGLSYDDVGDKAVKMANKVAAAAKRAATTNSIKTLSNNLTEQESQKKILEAEKKYAKENLDAMKKAQEKTPISDGFWGSVGDFALGVFSQDARDRLSNYINRDDLKKQGIQVVNQDDIDDLQEKYDKASDALDDCNEKIKKTRYSLGEVSSETIKDMSKITDLNEGTTKIVDNVSNSVETLATAYDEAYTSALESIQGQYNLWDKVEKISATSTSSIKSNLQSQVDYWNTYNKNWDKLSGKTSEVKGLNEVLKELTKDASPEAANMLAGMANMSTKELKEVVALYNKRDKSQQGASSGVATVQSDYLEQLNKTKNDVEKMINSLDVSGDAKKSARATLNAYFDEIEKIKNERMGTLTGISEDVASALNGTKINLGKGNGKGQVSIVTNDDGSNKVELNKLPGHADGTDNAERGWAIVGEEGPELKYFAGGETVIPAEQTKNILNNGFKSTSAGSERTLNININGQGALKVSANVSKKDAAELVVSQIEPALVRILTDEIIEGGDGTYEL